MWGLQTTIHPRKKERARAKTNPQITKLSVEKEVKQSIIKEGNEEFEIYRLVPRN